MRILRYKISVYLHVILHDICAGHRAFKRFQDWSKNLKAASAVPKLSQALSQTALGTHHARPLEMEAANGPKEQGAQPARQPPARRPNHQLRAIDQPERSRRDSRPHREGPRLRITVGIRDARGIPNTQRRRSRVQPAARRIRRAQRRARRPPRARMLARHEGQPAYGHDAHRRVARDRSGMAQRQRRGHLARLRARRGRAAGGQNHAEAKAGMRK